MFRDEVYAALRETEPEWLGSFRGAYEDLGEDIPPSEPFSYGDEVVSGEVQPITEDFDSDGYGDSDIADDAEFIQKFNDMSTLLSVSGSQPVNDPL